MIVKRSSRWIRLGVAGVLVLGSVSALAVGSDGVAAAATGDGTLTVQVLRDVLGTGVINASTDVPQQGMAVVVTDPAGARVQGTTDSTGKVVVAPSTALAGGQYRVDVSIPAPFSGYLTPAPASTVANHFDSVTSFADVRAGRDATVTTGVWNAADYARTDSPYYVPVQTPTVNANGTANSPNGAALVSFPPGARGPCTPTPTTCGTTLNTQAQVGTTFGLAYDRYRDRIFQSAFARRLTQFGPGGGGAIYSQPAGGGAPSLFAVVPGSTITPHNPLDDPRKDSAYVDVPGKEGLGGIATTEDGANLYAVNLLTRSLVRFDATGPMGVPTAVTPIPDPGCASPTDWRPFAVEAHDAKLYVGGVCSAESTGNRADLKAVVYTVNGATFTPVLTKSLDFHRGNVQDGLPRLTNTDYWNPWDTRLGNWDDRNAGGGPGGPYVDPQPELASLAFARDGSMILGFRDRFMDSVGSGGFDPRPGNNTTESGVSGGDINHACAVPTGGYAWEGTGGCPNHATPATAPGQAADVVEYYPGDYYTAGTHHETAQGSVAFKPQQQDVVSTELDPAVNVNSTGAGFYDVNTGAGPGTDRPGRGYEIATTPNPPDLSGFAEAGGLGDVTFAAATAPVQIGNRVWYDGDRNGVQDPQRADEVPLQGARVDLLDGNAQVATTTTSAAGEYYFGGVGAAYQLVRGKQYTVRYNVCSASTATVPGTPPAGNLRFTLPAAGTDRALDSNVVPPTTGSSCVGSVPVTAPTQPGGVDHTIDAGVYNGRATTCEATPPRGAIVGTAGKDRLIGTPGDDVIYGLDGNDLIDGQGGNDLLCGGPANDAIYGGAGDDLLFGQDGGDALFGQDGNDALSGGPGGDSLDGGPGVNTSDGGPDGDACRNPSTGPGCP